MDYLRLRFRYPHLLHFHPYSCQYRSSLQEGHSPSGSCYFPSEDISEMMLFFLVAEDGLLILSWGLGFFGVSSSKEITNPRPASASSFNFSVFIWAKVSASSSVNSVPPLLDLNDDGPETSPEPRRLFLKVELMVGL